MKMFFHANHASRLQFCWHGTRKDSTLCFLLALLSLGCLHHLLFSIAQSVAMMPFWGSNSPGAQSVQFKI